MKKMTMVAALLVVIGIVFIGVAVSSVGGNYNRFIKESSRLTEKEYRCSGNIDKVIILERSGRVEVSVADINAPYVEYKENERVKYDVTENGSTLSIKKQEKSNFFGVYLGFDEEKVHLYLPKDYAGELKVENASGAIRVTDYTGKSLEVSNTSGSVNISNITVNGDVKVENSSGALAVSNTECNNIFVSSSSGTTRLEDVYAKENADIKGTSGSIHFDNLKSDGNITAKNTSGYIRGTIVGKESDYSITAQATSGTNNLENSRGAEKQLYVKTTSGGIKVEFTQE